MGPFTHATTTFVDLIERNSSSLFFCPSSSSLSFSFWEGEYGAPFPFFVFSFFFLSDWESPLFFLFFSFYANHGVCLIFETVPTAFPSIHSSFIGHPVIRSSGSPSPLGFDTCVVFRPSSFCRNDDRETRGPGGMERGRSGGTGRGGWGGRDGYRTFVLMTMMA